MKSSRRQFITKSAAVAAGVAALAGEAGAAPLPQRKLARIGRSVSIIGIGTAPLGSDNTTPEEAERVLTAALEAGITYFDTAPVYGDPKSKYGNAEMKLKPFLAKHRKELFLVTKANPSQPDRDGAIRQVEASLQRLGVDYVDLVHIHNLGDFDMEKVLAPDGTLAGLKEAKKRGLIRHIGTSGHMRPARFVKAIETGEIDLVMNALNFADRSNYDFEGLVLPAAQKQNTAVVAMKVLGGAVKWAYDGKTPGCFADRYEQAVRYSLGLPGVCSAVIGLATVAEVRQAADLARRYKPLSAAEREALLTEGRKLADSRGLYYGPVTG